MIYIKVSDFQVAEIEGIDLKLSMSNFCKELYELFITYYPQFTFNIDWNDTDSICFENEVIDLQTYEDLKQDLLNFQTVVFERQTWVISKQLDKKIPA